MSKKITLLENGGLLEIHNTRMLLRRKRANEGARRSRAARGHHCFLGRRQKEITGRRGHPAGSGSDEDGAAVEPGADAVARLHRIDARHSIGGG